MKKLIVSLFLIVVSIAASLWYYPQLPDEITTNLAYNPVTSSKVIVAWIIPIVMISVYIVMLFIRRLTRRSTTPARMEGPTLGILNMTLLILLVVHLLILSYGMDNTFNEAIIGPLVTGVVLLATGNYLPQFSDNSSRQANDSNAQIWRKVRMFLSRTFVAGGIIILCGAFVPSHVLLPVFVTLLLATIMIMLGGFFYYAKRA